ATTDDVLENDATDEPANQVYERFVPLPAHVGASAPVLDLVIPVYNEQIDLAPCVRRLHGHLSSSFPYSFRLTIADNASTDATHEIAVRLARELPEVAVVHLAEKGR